MYFYFDRGSCPLIQFFSITKSNLLFFLICVTFFLVFDNYFEMDEVFFKE